MNKKTVLLVLVSLFVSAGISADILRWDWKKSGVGPKDFWHNISFPKNFVFGVADSAYQTEGSAIYDGKNIKNNWTEWEKKNNLPRVGCACNRWNTYKEDIKLLKKSGFTSYRFSVEWSKIEPQEGVFDERVMQHYKDVVDELLKNEIEPIICLFHQTWPLWFDAKDAFEKAENNKYFIEYAHYVFKKLGTRVKNWMTFNEPTGYAIEAYWRGKCAPGKKSLALAGTVLKNYLDSHVEIYHLFKAYDPEIMIGYSKIVHPVDPYNSWNPLEVLASTIADRLVNDPELEYFKTGKFSWGFPLWTLVSGSNKRAIGALDYIGVNYYSHTNLKMQLNGIITDKAVHEWETLTPYGKIIYPEGLYRAIQRCAVLGKPMYVTENGISDPEDTLREPFIKQHLYAVKRAIKDGYDVRGYYYWTLMDTFGWGKGTISKYGLYAVDFDTQKRTLRDGAKNFISFVQNHANKNI